MIRLFFIAIGFADSAVAGATRWVRKHWRMTVRARMLVAFGFGAMVAKGAADVDSLAACIVLALLVVYVLLGVDEFAAQRGANESANSFAIRVAKEHGVEAKLHVTNTIIVVDPPTWHRLQAKGHTITADGHIEVQS